jgi:hypothetical protein
MSMTEVITSEQTIDIMEERRIHRIPLMSSCRDVRSRRDLIVLIKILLDDLEKTDPPLRAKIVQVRDIVSSELFSLAFNAISRTCFSLSGRS